jgi:hypothetical protein
MVVETIFNEAAVKEGLHYILSHFEHHMQLWSRTISTKTTEGRQLVVYSKQEAITRFKQANFMDCRISAYPYWRPSITSNFVGIKNTIAPNFIMIDLDLINFELCDKVLLHMLRQTLRKIKEILQLCRPTVIWSGNGYHIYIPIDAPVLENMKEFSGVEQVSTSSSGLQNGFYRMVNLTQHIITACRSITVCLGFQDLLIQRIMPK